MSNHDQNNRHDDQYEGYAQYGGQNVYQDNRYDDQYEGYAQYGGQNVYQDNRYDDQYESYAQYGGQNAYQDNRYDDQRSEKAFEIELASAGQLKQYRYTFDSLGNVTAEQERKGNGYWKSERIDADEHFSTVQLQGVSYLVKTESSDDGIEFQLLRDDNRDGVWTQIAEGETMGLYIDSVTGTIDLVGIQNYLAPVDVIIG